MANFLQAQQIVAWPTYLYKVFWPAHEAESAAILAHLYERKAQFAANVDSGVALAAKSRQGLFESHFELFASPHSGLTKLKLFCEEVMRQIVSQVNGAQVDQRRVRAVLTESWFHITNDGGFHDAHVHNQCSWCGIYYLQAGDCAPSDASGPGNGVNRFYSPLPNGGAIADYGNAYLKSNRIDIVPTDGMLFVFPSYLMHSALAYRGSQDRVVISFNSQTTIDG